jgi:hypothetical protein
MACCCSRFPVCLPYTSATFQVWPSEEAPMLRLFALLLVCLVLPVRALTLTPVAGAAPPLGARLPAGWRLPRQRAPWAPAAHRCGRQPPCGLRPAALAATGQGGCSISPWTAMAGSISATASRGRGAGTAVARARLQKRPSSTGNCCFAKSPRWLAAPTSAPAWC